MTAVVNPYTIADYDVIATLGPSSADAATWDALLAAGATQFRLNTSHASGEHVAETVAALGRSFDRRGHAVPVVLDLQGSKWRVGEVEPGDLEDGTEVELVLSADAGGSAPSGRIPVVLPVPHADFFAAARASDGRVSLNDARCRLQIEEATGERVIARVTSGGPISRAKGITVPATSFRSEGLREKDRSIVSELGGRDFVRFAVSYVKDAAEMETYRREMPQRRYLIAKVERPTAVADAAALAELSDEMWLCRGDLGAEMGLPAMAEAAYEFSRRVSGFPVPVALAGQVLEHMTREPHPTRAEVVQLYEALQAGFSGVVLSDETAAGAHVARACETAALFRPGHGA